MGSIIFGTLLVRPGVTFISRLGTISFSQEIYQIISPVQVSC